MRLTFLLLTAMLIADQKFEVASISEVTVGGHVGVREFSSDGKRVFFADGPSLWIADVATGSKRMLTTAAVTGFNALLSPDGQTIYAVRLDNQLFRIRMEGGAPEKLADGVSGWPHLSPDGKRLAFIRRDHVIDKNSGLPRPFADSLAVYDLQSRTERTVKRWEKTLIFLQAWSPDGDRVVLMDAHYGRPPVRFLMLSIANGAVTELSLPGDDVTDAFWPSGDAGLYALRQGPKDTDPLRIVNCRLPCNSWRTVYEGLPQFGASNVKLQSTADGLVLATTRRHTAETFLDNFLGIFLWKQPTAYVFYNELVLIRLRKKPD